MAPSAGVAGATPATLTSSSQTKQCTVTSVGEPGGGGKAVKRGREQHFVGDVDLAIH